MRGINRTKGLEALPSFDGFQLKIFVRSIQFVCDFFAFTFTHELSINNQFQMLQMHLRVQFFSLFFGKPCGNCKIRGVQVKLEPSTAQAYAKKDGYCGGITHSSW